MAATEKQLGDLHQEVAKALTAQVQGLDEPVFDAEGGVVATKKIAPSPALLGAAIAFLKNNNITADAEGNQALKELNAKLAERRVRKVPQSALDEAASAYAATVGAGSMSLQ